MEKIFTCIDLKSFYASVECCKRGLNPLTTNLVVADPTRTAKTVCLAITPSLKQYGLKGRARVYEVESKVRAINYDRLKKAPYHRFTKKTVDDIALKNNSSLELDFIIAPPHMADYMEYSTKIFNIYLKYIAPEDIYSYSIDEVFCNLTSYLSLYNLTPKELVTKMIKDVYDTTGITATAGLGPNMFLCKVAMDIVAKHTEPNEFGVRIAELTEATYREKLWSHEPLTDFWGLGPGHAAKLKQYNLNTMGDIALCSKTNEDLLYKLFGVNAELIIDHAWGYEPVTIDDIKKYKPETKSLSSGQVLSRPYNYEKTKLVIREMAESLSLDLVRQGYITDQIVLHVGYDIENLTNPLYSRYYSGPINKDGYGRNVPKSAHGTIRLETKTSSTQLICTKTLELFDHIINKNLLIRRLYIYAANLKSAHDTKDEPHYQQFDIFTNFTAIDHQKKSELARLEDEKKVQQTILDIKKKYGKNAILKGVNLEEGATTIKRNGTIGGHRA